jgi:hypothetical protein
MGGNFCRPGIAPVLLRSGLANRRFQGLLEGRIAVQGPGPVKIFEAVANSQALLSHLGQNVVGEGRQVFMGQDGGALIAFHGIHPTDIFIHIPFKFDATFL